MTIGDRSNIADRVLNIGVGERTTPGSPLYDFFTNMTEPDNLRTALQPIREAIDRTVITGSDSNSLGIACETALDAATLQKSREPSLPLSVDEIAVIKLYSMENSFYVILNNALRTENRSSARPFIKVTLSA